MIIGLTGGYAAGKNTAAAILEARGWTAIDVDRLGHEAVELAKDRIVERFGIEVLGPDGRIDRRALSRRVFSEPGALKDQEAIIHPVAIALLDKRIAEAEDRALSEGRPARILINAALLYLAPQLARCEAVIEVRAPLPIRVARGMRRDRLSLLEILRRVKKQRRLWRLRDKAGIRPLVLRNTGSTEGLAARLERILHRLA